MDEMKQIALLEEELQDLYNERKLIDKKFENLELEKEVIFNKEDEIRNKISKIKDSGTNRFLGKFAVVKNKWGSRKHYIYITSVATEYHGCLAAFAGPNFCLDTDKHFTRTDVCCIHQSAHDNYVVTIESPEHIKLITKEEFIQAFDEFQKNVSNMMHTAINATPRRITKDEYRYDEEMFDKLEE